MKNQKEAVKDTDDVVSVSDRLYVEARVREERLRERREREEEEVQEEFRRASARKATSSASSPSPGIARKYCQVLDPGRLYT